MPLQDVFNMISELRSNKDFRINLNKADNADEGFEFLKSKGYKFTFAELEDAERALLVKCQTQEQAQELKEQFLWLKFLLSEN